MAKNDLYSKGLVLNYSDNTVTLDRTPVQYSADKGDKLHTVIKGETLRGLANRYYKDGTYWFLIADCNNIENPLFLEIGVNLIIPNLNKYLL